MSEMPMPLNPTDFVAAMSNSLNSAPMLTTKRETVPEDWSDESSEEKESRNFQFSDSPRVKTSEKEIKDILTATHKFASLVAKWTTGSKKDPEDSLAKIKKTRLVDVFQMVDGLERAAKELDKWYQKGPAKIRFIAEELKRANSLDLSNSLNCQNIDRNLRCVQQVLDQFPNFHDTNITEERPPGVATRYMYSDSE
nr:unnamed protein product [Haemonchus contortus]